MKYFLKKSIYIAVLLLVLSGCSLPGVAPPTALEPVRPVDPVVVSTPTSVAGTSDESPKPELTAQPTPIPTSDTSVLSEPQHQSGDEPAEAEPIIYMVKQGDTLYSIARSFGLTWQTIATTNGIVDPTKLAVGQQLIIPNGVSNGSSSEVPLSFEEVGHNSGNSNPLGTAVIINDVVISATDLETLESVVGNIPPGNYFLSDTGDFGPVGGSVWFNLFDYITVQPTAVTINGIVISATDLETLESVVGNVPPGNYFLSETGDFGPVGGSVWFNLFDYMPDQASENNGYYDSGPFGNTGSDGSCSYYFDPETGASVMTGDC